MMQGAAMMWRVLLCGALLAGLMTGPALGTTLVVSTNDDLVNGDTSCPAALIANPGTDGISLREAVLAIDNASSCNDPGPHTITFSSALAGQTIAPTSAAGCCYIITQDGVTITGLLGADGQPAVTIDASNMFILFSVSASNFTLTSLRMIGLQAASPGDKYGISVRAGAGTSQPEQHVSNIAILGNVFSNNPGVNAGIPVSVGMNMQANGATLSNVTIANNTFNHFQGGTDAVNVQLWGTNNLIEDVLILENAFTDITFPIELVPAFSTDGQILRTRIVGNSFSSSQQPINLNDISDDGQPVATGNLIDGTVIELNMFNGNRGPAITLLGGQTDTGTGVDVFGNAITNTTIVNNLVVGDTTYGAVSVVGGRRGSTQNAVSGVSIINNTFVNYTGVLGDGGAISVNANLEGSSGNTVSGIAIANTVLWNNTPSDFDGVTASQVANSITKQSGFAGVNGNIGTDPKFVNSSAGDFHIQAGSPAIGAGTHNGAPAYDLDCQPRPNPPAIGAYETGETNLCPTTLIVEEQGSGTVTSSPSGVNCGGGGACFANFAGVAQVTLSAKPNSGWLFLGWGGACMGSGSCTVAMNACFRSPRAAAAP
jgi:hypothetical protein